MNPRHHANTPAADDPSARRQKNLLISGIWITALVLLVLLVVRSQFGGSPPSTTATPPAGVVGLPAKPASAAARQAPEPSLLPTIEEQWGIEVTSVMLTAGGRMLDVRYRVLDRDRAASLASRLEQLYLLDQASGRKLPLPRAPKLGTLQRNPTSLSEDRNYVLLFGNPDGLVKSGSRVSLVLGDYRMRNITVP